MHGSPSDRPRRRRTVRLTEVLLALGAAAFFCRWVAGAAAASDGVALVQDHQAAVAVDFVSGAARPLQEPGYHLYVPYLRGVYALDKSPREYVMEGNDFVDANHVPRLIVRAKDGSSFWFATLNVQYALDVRALETALADSGPGDGFHEGLVNAFARSILRDEFGRFTAEEIVLPDNRQAAVLGARERLNAALAPHGVEVLELSASKPMFAQAYEDTIERRKVADQETESLQLHVAQLRATRELRMGKIEREKELELEIVRGQLASELEKAEKKGLRAVYDADAYYDGKLLSGSMALMEKQRAAEGNTEKYKKAAEGFLAKAEALAEQGELAVRAALVEKLRSIEFELVPYSRRAPEDAPAKGASY